MVAPRTDRIAIVLIQPHGYTGSLALLEVGEFLKLKLEQLGFKTSFLKNRYDQNSTNIILGAHLLDTHEFLPPRTIILNTEQVGDSNSMAHKDTYLEILSRYYIWDYSAFNTSLFKHQNFDIIQFGYEEGLKRLRNDIPKEYDLIFYGSINPRREKIISSLSAKGITIQVLSNVYASERDFFIERSRAILNLHFYDTKILQQVRVFYPLINGFPIVSEAYPAASAPFFYDTCILKPDGEDFIKYTCDVVEKLRHNAEALHSSIARFQQTSNCSNVQQAIENTLSFFHKRSAKSIPLRVPAKKINLGSGKNYKAGYLNIDINKSTCPDLLLDLSSKLEFPISSNDISGMPVDLNEHQFEEIVANDVLEHVADLRQLMTNCLKLLAEGGKMLISVPYDLSLGAWQDPTHVRSFNQNSWLYYTDWFWYLGWFEYCFEMSSLTYIPSEYGASLVSQNLQESIILSTPRAIDSMNVIFVKRKTTIDERTLVRTIASKII